MNKKTIAENMRLLRGLFVASVEVTPKKKIYKCAWEYLT